MDIKIIGAKENNLKNIDISIPLNKFVVFTGVSGSGKSSLAFDTIYKEGQRRYLETFSSYARNFIGSFERPNVDYISGLSPVISIEQKTIAKNPRSTVGTITEIYDYLRLLYAKIGVAKSFNTNEAMTQNNPSNILKGILNEFMNEEVIIMSPIIKSRKGHYSELFQSLIKMGYFQVHIDNQITKLTPSLKLDRYKTHNIAIIIDKLTINTKSLKRLENSVNLGLKESKGSIIIQNTKNNTQRYLSLHLTCPTTGISYEKPEPNSFSFNSPKGYCKACTGLGETEEIDIRKIIPNDLTSINNGGIIPIGEYKNNWIFQQIKIISKKYKFSIKDPIKEMPQEALQSILYGLNDRFKEKNKILGITKEYTIEFEGVINFIKNQHSNHYSKRLYKWSSNFFKKQKCQICNGDKLKKESLYFFINQKNISEVCNYDIIKLKQWCQKIPHHIPENQLIVAKEIIKELLNRINFLINVGLEYITVSRRSDSLSGGESQRIRIASQIGSELTNVLYILDEPSVGLHPSDNALLIKSLKKLKNLGNSIIVVEHDKSIMESSDHIIDIGPGAGEKGGNIVFSGKYNQLTNCQSLTSKYLFHLKNTSIKKNSRKGNGKHIEIYGASGNNLQNINISIPLGKIVVITGVSGSGKSTLINGTLYPILYNKFYNSNKKTYKYLHAKGLEHIDKVININQTPIGKNSRSNPATYVGIFTEIRQLFANLKESKIRGYNLGRFSFNVKNGNCEECEGSGVIIVQMKLLPDIETPCKSCKGKRFNKETLEITYNKKNIYDVLEMSVDEALAFFKKIPKIQKKLESLNQVGMGYITLGQSSTKLSGGEAQRVKLATELTKKSTGNTLYILDEPTTGLHFHDINILMKAINLLTDKGNSIIIVEHNIDIIKQSDHIIDLGPGGGKHGGQIIFEGNVKDILNNKNSLTGFFLKKEISSHNE